MYEAYACVHVHMYMCMCTCAHLEPVADTRGGQLHGDFDALPRSGQTKLVGRAEPPPPVGYVKEVDRQLGRGVELRRAGPEDHLGTPG